MHDIDLLADKQAKVTYLLLHNELVNITSSKASLEFKGEKETTACVFFVCNIIQAMLMIESCDQ